MASPKAGWLVGVWTSLWLGACGSTRPVPASPAMRSADVAGTVPAARVPRRPFISPHSYASYMRAEVLSGRGEHAEAAALYRVAVAESGPDPWLESRLARALQAAGQLAEAEAVVRDALGEHPHWVLWLQLGRLLEAGGSPEQAIGAYERAMGTMATEDGAQGALALADLLRRRNQPERAIAVLEDAARRSPRHGADAATAELELGLARRDPDGVERAVARLRGLQAVPRKRLIEAAALELDAGRAVLAARLLDTVPVGPDSAALRVRALLAAGRKADAGSLLITLEPEALGGRVPTAKALLQAGQPTQALTLAQEAMLAGELSAPSPTATLTRDRARVLAARAWLALGQPGQAAAVLGTIAGQSPTQPEAQALRAEALRDAGMAGLAAEALSVTRPAAGVKAGVRHK